MKNVTFIFSNNSKPAFEVKNGCFPALRDECRSSIHDMSSEQKFFIFTYDALDGITVENILEYLQTLTFSPLVAESNFLQFVRFMKYSNKDFKTVYQVVDVAKNNELELTVYVPCSLILPGYPYDSPESQPMSKTAVREKVINNIDRLKADLMNVMRLDYGNIKICTYPKLPASLVFDEEPIAKTEYFQPKPDLENHKHHFGVNNMQTQPNYNQIPQLFGTDNNTLICVELNFPKVNVMANQIFNDIIDSNFSDDVFMSSHFVGVNLAMEFGGILASIKKTLLHDMKYRHITIVLPTTPRGVLLDAFKYVYAHLGFVFIEKPTNAKLIADLLTEAHAESFKLISAVNLLYPAGGYQPIGGNQYPWHSNDLNSRFNTGIVPPNPFGNPMYGAINGMAMDIGRMASEQTRFQTNLQPNVSCACGSIRGATQLGKSCDKCGTDTIAR